VGEVSRCAEFSKNHLKTVSRTIFKERKIIILNSYLFFTEYVDCRYRLEKLNYSYHCQDSNGTLIFRYDNAAHKPVLPHCSHKHEPTGNIIAAEPPELSAILDEVMEQYVL
jgi:hypothetical protein